MNKALIIGGAGFIGSNVARRCLDEEMEVVVFDNLSRKGCENNLLWLESFGDYRLVEGDVRDYDSLLAVMREGFDVVFHLAAQVAVTTSVENPRLDFESNALGTFNVLEAISQADIDPVLIYSSTNKVYGQMQDVEVVEGENRYAYKREDAAVSEEQPLDFHSPYGCSKGAGDQYVRDYSRMYGVRSIVFRQSCIYGPRQMGGEEQGWVAWFIIASTTGKPITIFGDGKQVRDVLYIDDLLDAYWAAIKRIDTAQGETYNIGGGMDNTLSLLELLSFLDGADYSFDKWRPGDQKVFICDIGKANRDLGWRPKVSPKEGVEQLKRWVRENRTLFDE